MTESIEHSISNQELQMLAKARASFSAFLSVHFLNLPDEALIQQIRSDDFKGVLEGLIKDENIHSQIAQGAELMQRFIDQTRTLGVKELLETLGVDRTRLYRGVSPGYSPPPPYEAVWSPDTSNLTELLQRIAGIYRQDGLVPAPDTHERVDYIGIELAYLENLARDELRHLEAGDEEQAGGLRQRQGSFLAEHLAEWVPLFVEKALEYAKTDFYRGHLLMLLGFILEQREVLSELSTSA